MPLPSSCHNTLISPPCRCPEYEADPDHSSAACDLCHHALEWHHPPLEIGSEEGRERKARGEEVLERCKDATGDGRECPCPSCVRGAAGECGLCGHKKGWHKWKDSQNGATSPLSSPSSMGSYGSYPSTTYFPTPLAIPHGAYASSSSYGSPPHPSSAQRPPPSDAEAARLRTLAKGKAVARSPSGSSSSPLPRHAFPPVRRAVSIASVGGSPAPEDPEFYRNEPVQRRPVTTGTRSEEGLGTTREGGEEEGRSDREQGEIARERTEEGRRDEDRVVLNDRSDPARGVGGEERERQGSVAGSASGSVDLGRGASAELFSVPSVGGVQPRWKNYAGKNLTLSVSPPLDSGQRFSPGQVFLFRLTLGSKVALSSYDKVQVRLVGNSYVNSEPPDDHDFLSLRTTIAPLSESDHGVEAGVGLRSLSWAMTLPLDQTCRCRPYALPLPPSYTHASFRVTYRFELVTKKHGAFSKLAGVERLKIQFPVDAPFDELPRAARSTNHVAPALSGIDGSWLTTRLDSPESRLNSNEVHPLSSVIRIPYRITFLLRPLHAPLTDSCRISLSRQVVLIDSTGKERSLNELRVPFEESRKRAEVVGRGWRWEGELEVVRSEATSLETCNVSVRYTISVVSDGDEVRLVARNLDLEVTTNSANPTLERRTSLIDPHLASGSVPLAPYGIQLQDSRRPPSFAGSSFGSPLSPIRSHESSIDSLAISPRPGSQESASTSETTSLDRPPMFAFDDAEGQEEPPPPFENTVGVWNV